MILLEITGDSHFETMYNWSNKVSHSNPVKVMQQQLVVSVRIRRIIGNCSTIYFRELNLSVNFYSRLRARQSNICNCNVSRIPTQYNLSHNLGEVCDLDSFNCY